MLLTLVFFLAWVHGRTLLMAIFSRPENYAKRQLIRATWAKSEGQTMIIKHVFIMGHSPNEAMQRQVMRERAEQDDMILLPYDDTPGNRGKKVRDAMELAFRTMQASFFLKCSDEIMLNVAEVEESLQSHLKGKWETPIYLSVIDHTLFGRLQQESEESSSFYDRFKMAAILNDAYLISAGIGEWILRQPSMLPASLPEWIDPADDGMLMKWWTKEFDEQVIGSIWIIDPRVYDGCEAREDWLLRRGLERGETNCLWVAKNSLSIQAACCHEQ